MKMLTRGKSEILKLLRVPRGSVRGKMRRARRRRRSVALHRPHGDFGAGASQEGWQNHERQNHFFRGDGQAGGRLSRAEGRLKLGTTRRASFKLLSAFLVFGWRR